MDSKVSVLIPARRASSRLADKLLLSETGKPVIIHTCEQVAKAFSKETVIVCTDDDEIFSVVEKSGFTAIMTSVNHKSGTDRIAEAAEKLDADIFVNVQADEPEIDPVHIKLVASLLEANDWSGMATLATLGNQEDQNNQNAVKVILGAGVRAISFTRAPAPWNRDANAPDDKCYRHIGIYAYRKDILLNYKKLPESHLEAKEKLEQLRAIEAGIQIACAVVEDSPSGIDVQADYDAFIKRTKKGNE